VSEIIVISDNEIELIEVGSQGPAGISAQLDAVSIDLNDVSQAEIKGFKSATDNTRIVKKSGTLLYKDDGKFGDVTGGDYTGFKDNGRQEMSGAARGWRDELGDILTIQNSGTGFSLNPSECTVDVIQGANLSDFLYKNTQLNHDRDLTSNIFPHIHFFQTQNFAPNFLIEYRWQINGGSKVTGWTRIPCNTLVHNYVSGTLNQIATTASGIPVPVGTDISDIVQFKFYRDNANASGEFAGASSYTGTISLLSFDTHILFDTLGSETQGAK